MLLASFIMSSLLNKYLIPWTIHGVTDERLTFNLFYATAMGDRAKDFVLKEVGVGTMKESLDLINDTSKNSLHGFVVGR